MNLGEMELHRLAKVDEANACKTNHKLRESSHV
jgi:hypothetical protein